jgi:hypothetical protein
LNWTLDGLTRLLRRGRYDIPEQVAASIQGFKDSTTPVAEWARTMLVHSDASVIERGDLLCAFQGWWRHEPAAADSDEVSECNSWVCSRAYIVWNEGVAGSNPATPIAPLFS